jgi:hypothetical protein
VVQVLRTQLVVLTAIDFSDAIRKGKKWSYATGSGRREDEMDEERFSRLHLEIAQLQDRILAEPETGDAEKMEHMQSELGKWRALIEMQSELRSSSLRGQRLFSGDLEHIDSVSRLDKNERSAAKADTIISHVTVKYKVDSFAELERRLSDIEGRLGGRSSDWQNTVTKLLMVQPVLDLLVSPDSENILQDKIEALNKIAERRNRDDFLSNDLRIKEIYASLNTITKLKPAVVSLSERLKTLAALHADSNHVREGFMHIEQYLENVNTEVVSWKRSLDEVSNKMVGLGVGLQQNSDAVEDAISALEKRLSELEAA